MLPSGQHIFSEYLKSVSRQSDKGYNLYRVSEHSQHETPCTATILKKDFTKEQLKETTAYQAMERIGMLYKIEEMIRGKLPEEKIPSVKSSQNRF